MAGAQPALLHGRPRGSHAVATPVAARAPGNVPRSDVSYQHSVASMRRTSAVTQMASTCTTLRLSRGAAHTL